MEVSHLIEYRCACGKLLFKGLLLISMIEIKCKRCGETRLIHEINDGLIGPSSFGILLDLNGSIVQASQNAASALGYKLNELFSMYVNQLNPSMALPFYKRLRQTCADHGRQNWITDAFYRAKNGSLVTLSTRFKFLEINNAPYTFLTLEITPPSADSRRSDEPRFGSYPDEIFFEIDANGFCTNISKTADTALGYKPEYLLGKPLYDFCPALRGNEKDARPMCVRNAGKPFEVMHNVFIGRDGLEKPLESHFVCDYKNNGFAGYRVYSWMKTPA